MSWLPLNGIDVDASAAGREAGAVAELRDLVVDCRRPSAVAGFWAAVLHGYAIAPYDEAELARLRELGVDDVADDPTVLVEPVATSGPRFFFQQVAEIKTVKNRLHLDLVAVDYAADLATVLRLGGRVADEYEDHVVLFDVEENEFCLMRDGWASRTR